MSRKAFFGHVLFLLVHIDTHYKIPEIIEYRDRLAMEWKFENRRISKYVKWNWPRYRLNHDIGKYIVDQNTGPYTGVIVGVR